MPHIFCSWLNFNILLFFRGFSSVYLVEDALTRRKYAIKKVICHSAEDQQIAAKEIEYHTILKHVNIIECIDSTSKGAADPVINATSQVLLVLPYYHVIIIYQIINFESF